MDLSDAIAFLEETVLREDPTNQRAHYCLREWKAMRVEEEKDD
jgi:hypothetical protein